MNEKVENWDRLFDTLPVDTEGREGHRQELESRVLDAFDASDSPQELTVPKSSERKFMSSSILRLALAASLLIGLSLAFSIGNRPAFAVDKLVDKIVNASTARWDMVLQREGSEDHQITVTLTPNGYRLESELQIAIVNWDTGKGLGLFPQMKQAVETSVSKQAIANTQVDEFLKIRDDLREAMLDPKQNVEALGEQRFGLHMLTGFRFHTSGRSIDVWADPKTQFPERIEIPIGGNDKGVLWNYETNIEVDETLLSTELPDGYRLLPGEVDLLATLRISCEQAGGAFPPSLGIEAIGELSSHFLTTRSEENGTASNDELVEQMLEFNRGFAFLISLVSDPQSEVHYAGKGVRLNDADRPILWYKAKDSDRYRVIDASLDVQEQATAPDVSGASRL